MKPLLLVCVIAVLAGCGGTSATTLTVRPPSSHGRDLTVQIVGPKKDAEHVLAKISHGYVYTKASRVFGGKRCSITAEHSVVGVYGISPGSRQLCEAIKALF